MTAICPLSSLSGGGADLTSLELLCALLVEYTSFMI